MALMNEATMRLVVNGKATECNAIQWTSVMYTNLYKVHGVAS